MANKWRTTVAEANAVLHKYSVNPSNLVTEVLVRRWDGIDRTYVDAARTILKAAKTVTDPKADNITFSGAWTVGNVWYDPVNGSNIAGSTSIYQELKVGNNLYATPDNLSLVRSRSYPLEQNENSWMYYERFKTEDTSRWKNVTYAGLNDEVYEGLRQIRTYDAWVANRLARDDKFDRPPPYTIGYYDRLFLYNIIYDETGSYGGASSAGLYYILSNPTYRLDPYDGLETSWFGTWTAIATPVIREVWHEENEDGTYDIFRTLETTNTTAIMRTRALTYAGMILVQGLPALGDTTLTLWGFEKTTEKIYKHARFMVGSTTYRVTADATCVATDVGGVEKGQATVSITPSVAQATEDSCDDYPGQVQAFFVAL